LDYFLEEWSWRPSAIVCYSAGAYGGVRAAMQLRAMLAELGMPSIPSLLPVAKVQAAFDENGAARDPRFEKRASRFLDELEWYADALATRRKDGVPY
jgi:NAD(P)H-dependent FMN reductase